MNKERKWWGLVVNGVLIKVDDFDVEPSVWAFDCPISEGFSCYVVPVEVKEVTKHR